MKDKKLDLQEDIAVSDKDVYIETSDDPNFPPRIVGELTDNYDYNEDDYDEDGFYNSSVDNEDDLWKAGWIATPTNIDDGPFETFEEIKFSVTAQGDTSGKEYALPEIPNDIKEEYLDEFGNWYMNAFDEKNIKEIEQHFATEHPEWEVRVEADIPAEEYTIWSDNDLEYENFVMTIPMEEVDNSSIDTIIQKIENEFIAYQKENEIEEAWSADTHKNLTKAISNYRDKHPEDDTFDRFNAKHDMTDVITKQKSAGIKYAVAAKSGRVERPDPTVQEVKSSYTYIRDRYFGTIVWEMTKDKVREAIAACPNNHAIEEYLLNYMNTDPDCDMAKAGKEAFNDDLEALRQRISKRIPKTVTNKPFSRDERPSDDPVILEWAYNEAELELGKLFARYQWSADIILEKKAAYEAIAAEVE